MGKLISFISIVCIINVLAIGGLAGYLWGTGRLDKSKAQTIGDMLKQQGTPEKFRENVYDLLVPVATTAPATSTAPATGVGGGGPGMSHSDLLEPATAAERIEFVQNMREEQRLRLEGEVQDLRHGHELLAHRQSELDGVVNKLKTDQQAFDKMTVAASTRKDQAGFEKTMSILQELKPKQVKELLTAMPTEEAVKYLSAMEPDQAAKIIAEYKPAEKATVTDVLERIRTGKAPAAATDAAGGASAAPGAAQSGGTQSAAASPAFTVRETP